MEEYEVDELLDHRMKDGRAEYLVKWKGFSRKHNTWEPETNIVCKNLIKRFEAKKLKTSPTGTEEIKLAAPKIVNATTLQDELCFIVEWPNKELELIPVMEIYTEFPLHAFEFYEKNMQWVQFGDLQMADSKALADFFKIYGQSGSRPTRKLTKKGQVSKPVKPKVRETKIVPTILDGIKIGRDLFFLVKWCQKVDVEVIHSMDMYQEYALYVFKFFENCLQWNPEKGTSHGRRRSLALLYNSLQHYLILVLKRI